MKVQYFDAYELRLLELIAQEQASASDHAQKAQELANGDKPALGEYISHLSALERSSGIQKALLEYRSNKKHIAETAESLVGMLQT